MKLSLVTLAHERYGERERRVHSCARYALLAAGLGRMRLYVYIYDSGRVSSDFGFIMRYDIYPDGTFQAKQLDLPFATKDIVELYVHCSDDRMTMRKVLIHDMCSAISEDIGSVENINDRMAVLAYAYYIASIVGGRDAHDYRHLDSIALKVFNIGNATQYITYLSVLKYTLSVEPSIDISLHGDAIYSKHRIPEDGDIPMPYKDTVQAFKPLSRDLSQIHVMALINAHLYIRNLRWGFKVPFREKSMWNMVSFAETSAPHVIYTPKEFMKGGIWDL